jgi:Paraquat-inducible protein A
VDAEAMNMLLTALLKVVEKKLFEFPIRDIVDLNCWFATIPAPALDSRGVRLNGEETTLGIADFSGTFGGTKLNITCLDCGSPRMTELTSLLLTTEAQDSFKTTMGNMMHGFLGQMLSDLVQFQADRMLSEAPLLCPHSPDYDPNSVTEYHAMGASESTDDTYLMLFGIAIMVVIVLTAATMFFVTVLVRRRHNHFLSELPKDQQLRLKHVQARDDIMESKLNAATHSFFHSPEIPLILRWSMPIIILGNIALFLSGHLSLGAAVNIEAQVAGDIIRVDEFYEFSVAQSTIDIWNAGGKALALLILIFSGIWPYTKQLITLIVWFVPPSVLSISRRGSILLWLDWLAKWSMIDIFVIIVSIASFRVSIRSPDVGFLPQDFYSINLLVVPLWGLYSNMIAQIVSQISSHLIIHYHRKIVDTATSSFEHRRHLSAVPGLHGMLATNSQSALDLDLDKPGALRDHKFGRPHRGEKEKVVVKTWVSYLLIILATCVVSLVIIGCIFPSLTVDILGVIGVAVELGQGSDAASTSHSVFTIVQLLIQEAKYIDTAGSYVGLVVLSCLFIGTVLVVPIIQSLMLLRQWFSPMSKQQRTRTSIANETLQAWQYVEVYLIALFVACWQLGPISEFMFNTSCGQFDGFFSQMVQYGILKEEDAQCFSVAGFIEPGSIVLATAAIILAFLNTVVNKAVVQYFYDQKSELEKELFPEDGVSDLSAASGADGEPSEHAVKDVSMTKIHPVPVLFTDTFRWFLRSDSQNKESMSDSPNGNNSMDASHGGQESALSPDEAALSEQDVAAGIATAGFETEWTEPDKSCKMETKQKGNDSKGSTQTKKTKKKKKKTKKVEEPANRKINDVLSEDVSM